MDVILSVGAALATLLGVVLTARRPGSAEGTFLGRLAKPLGGARTLTSVDPQATPQAASGMAVLKGFAILVVAFGAFAAWYYRDRLSLSADQVMLCIGLFLIMVGGMFVRILAANRRAERALFDVTASQLIYPLLFSPIVFFTIWSLEARPEASMFLFHAAFLNGYFWESLVSEAGPERGAA